MLRHRRSFAVIVGGALGGALMASAGLAADVALDGVEYKLRLVPQMAEAPRRDALWTFLGATSAEVSQEKCRLVQFLDVAGGYVTGAGFIVRHRVTLDDNECPEAIPAETPRGKLTLKFRAADVARAEQEGATPPLQVGEHKLEEEVGLARADESRLAVTRSYSASAEVKDTSMPETVKALRKEFGESALSPMANAVPLVTGCRRILEEKWKLEPKNNPALPAEIELAVWYRVTTGGAKGEPLVVELSFKSKTKEPKSATRADQSLARLLRTIDPSWIAPGGSKTEAAGACDPR